jgi:transcriptional regulator with XRE-family HTH domain
VTGPSPTVRRRELGGRLRVLRLARGLTVEDVAARMEVSQAKISRIETAARGVSVADVRFLCEMYEVSPEDRERLLALTRESRRRSWWQEYGLPESLATYIGLETEAASILDYETSIVPALLQTEDYARAVVEGIMPDAEPKVVEQRVVTRLTRQQRLTEDHSLRLWTVIDEAALQRIVGSRQVMHAQLLQLTERAAFPAVTVQLIPFASGSHPGMDTNFTILQFNGPVSDVVYVEGLLGAHYLESPADLERYRGVFEHLRAIALSPKDSAARIRDIAGSYDHVS